jgi:hypothetical protein
MAATTYATYYQYELSKLLKEEIDRLTATITAEYEVVSDYSSYRYHIGQIRGLRRALELCDEAETVVNNRE